MKIKKIFLLPSLISLSLVSCLVFPSMKNTNTLVNANKNNEQNKIMLFGGSSSNNDKDNREPTEEEVREVKKLFWIEFGITAGFFVLILGCFITFVVIKKKKKQKII